MPFLEVKNLTHLYSRGTPFEVNAINDVSFTANKGEIIGIIGHTGSGKSTLMQHLNGLLKADSGSVFIDGKDIWENPKEIKKVRFKVGMVFQNPEHQLFDETIFEDIAYGPKNIGKTEEEIKEYVLYAAKLVGLDDELLLKSPFELSGGEMRRAAIAGVIAMKPQILVLDEPTAGLDPKGRELIMSRIIEYKNTTNATIILSSHSMEDIASIADKVLVMNNGTVFMYDTVQNVFSKNNELESIGLNVPQITKIMVLLKQKGIDINPNCFTVDEALNELKRYLKEAD